MNRKIKFRGKNKSGKWITGDLLQNRDKTYILSPAIANQFAKAEDFEVSPETVGQFIGLNKTDIYEDDIMDIDGTPFLVCWDEQYLCYFLMDSQGNSIDLMTCEHAKYEVIGNAHDNKDLVKSISNERKSI